MKITTLIKHRNTLPKKLLGVADWLIQAYFKDVPILGEMLKNPPPQPANARRSPKQLGVECWLSIQRINLMEEVDRREKRNAPYFGGVYKR